jgi:hemerythrin
MINITEETIQIKETQISEIDKQYQKIKSVFDQITQCIRNEEFGENLSALFFNLVYIHDHYFMQEQITLSKYNYPNLETIKKSQQLFLKEIIKYQTKIEKDAEASCKEMTQFILSWSKEYFEINEKAIEFLKGKGTK